MSFSALSEQGEVLYSSLSVRPATENLYTISDLPRSAIVFLCKVRERLGKLVTLSESAQLAPKEKAALDLLLSHVIRLLDLPASAAGMAEVNKQIERVIRDNTFRTKHKAAFEQLTPREKEVLALLALGLTNKEVADKLYVSLDTVKHHRKLIKSKLAISSTAGLVLYGQAFNLI